MAEIGEQPLAANPDGYKLPQDVMTLEEIEMDAKLEVKDNSSVGGNGNEESSDVESPTTGENYVFKCVFCERVLSGADTPKLLKCLHNSCGSCINNKLFEQNEGNAKGMCVDLIFLDSKFCVTTTNMQLVMRNVKYQLSQTKLYVFCVAYNFFNYINRFFSEGWCIPISLVTFFFL